MKIYRICNLFFAAITLSSFAYADESYCSNLDVHCSYFTNASIPKYIKVEPNVNGHTQEPYIICVDNKTTISLDKYFVETGIYPVGATLGAKYSQCETKKCKRSIRLNEESFVIKRSYEDYYYYSDPNHHNIVLNAGYGEDCYQSASKYRINGALPS